MERAETPPSKEQPETKLAFPLRREWKWGSDLGAVNVYEAQFAAVLKNIENSWLEEDRASLCVLGFREALINAIKYGNASDPAKHVRVEIEMDDHRLAVSVADENPALFNADAAFDSVKNKAEILAYHGRGLTMMRDAYPAGVSFEFLNPGNKVTMIVEKA